VRKSGCVVRRRKQIDAEAIAKGGCQGDELGLRQPGGDAAAAHLGWQHGAQQRQAFRHEVVHGGAGAIPFQHGEFGGMAGAALLVAPDAGQLEYRPGTADQQAFHGEFGAGVQPKRLPSAIDADAFGAEGGEMDLLAGRGHRIGRLDLGVAARGEEGADRLGEPRAAAQERQAGRKLLGVPGGLGRLRHSSAMARGAACHRWIARSEL
jgi:hypothetical protein